MIASQYEAHTLHYTEALRCGWLLFGEPTCRPEPQNIIELHEAGLSGAVICAMVETG